MLSCASSWFSLLDYIKMHGEQNTRFSSVRIVTLTKLAIGQSHKDNSFSLVVHFKRRSHRSTTFTGAFSIRVTHRTRC